MHKNPFLLNQTSNENSFLTMPVDERSRAKLKMQFVHTKSNSPCHEATKQILEPLLLET